VQISWDKGWRAFVRDQRVPAWADQLGQMIVEPRCSGVCEVELRYDGGKEHRLASLVCLMALIFGTLWIAIAYVKSIRLQ